MPQTKSSTKKPAGKGWFACYECDAWYTEESIHTFRYCPVCGNELIEMCPACKQARDECSCETAS